MADPRAESARAAENAARSVYSRLIAILTARTGDIASAEDALSQAFTSALKTWPEKGVPNAPEAWLLAAAKRNWIDRSRRTATASAAEPDLIQRIEEAAMDSADPDMPDPRLGLMFLCAHPAIDPAVRTPLMLQTVLGLSAERIASVFLIRKETMSARLVRAKSKVKTAGIPFGIPGLEAWHGRLDAVLSAVYGAYTLGQDSNDVTDMTSGGLRSEAEWLARLLVELLPDSGESKGLLALILFSEARRAARIGAAGEFVPLSEQDTTLWDAELIHEAQSLLKAASRADDGGRYQLEAAIQSVHALRAVTGQTDWATLLHLYDALMATSPSLGAAIARAAVLVETKGPDAALDALSDLPTERLGKHGPYHATLAHCLSAAGKPTDSVAAYRKAADLAPHPSVADWLLARAKQLTT